MIGWVLGGPAYPLVFVMLDHADAVLDDEQQVDAPQRRQALPHPVEGSQPVLGGPWRGRLPVVVLPLSLEGRGSMEVLELERGRSPPFISMAHARLPISA